jgi:16S rRNA (adenine1518-N6/adenine1519-N6)-dimethyltransferase
MLKAKKSLGQNFLTDPMIVERILAVAEIGADDQVFEVGPGTGMLTERLAAQAQKVVAIELDHQLVERLQQHFKASASVSILEGNILDVNLGEILAAVGFEAGQYKVVANIPYYITAPIIRTLLSLTAQPKTLTLMVQKEVAERLAAKPGGMSLLSLMAQYYSDVRIALQVPKEAFDPVPKVDSAVVHFRTKRIFDPEVDRQFFRVARAGFAARRKTLANNLASSLGLTKEVIEAMLLDCGLRKDVRAQALSLPDWERLQDILTLNDLPKACTPPIKTRHI